MGGAVPVHFAIIFVVRFPELRAFLGAKVAVFRSRARRVFRVRVRPPFRLQKSLSASDFRRGMRHDALAERMRLAALIPAVFFVPALLAAPALFATCRPR